MNTELIKCIYTLQNPEKLETYLFLRLLHTDKFDGDGRRVFIIECNVLSGLFDV